MTKKRVALGISGGVDSSVCAYLLQQQGYAVTGVYLECWRAPGCRTEEDRQDALKVALKFDLPFQVLDFKQAYRDKVVELFFDDYRKGKTPNPDILCNKEIKFGLFYDWAMQHGFDYVATGHYADIAHIENKQNLNFDNPKKSSAVQHELYLTIPKDEHKDQTYFLYLLDAEHLTHTIFPLANYTKPEVRDLAKKIGLHTAEKKDSVGICFIGDINVQQFLKDNLGKNPGVVVDTDDTIIGTHQGLWFYTIGQRHGFEIDKTTLIKKNDGSSYLKHNFPPYYVIGKNPAKNQLIVGFGAETLQDSFYIEQCFWVHPEKNTVWFNNCFVRIRHTGELLPARVTLTEAKSAPKASFQTAQVSLKQPTKGLAEGQSAVVYADHEGKKICLGGGVIKLN